MATAHPATPARPRLDALSWVALAAVIAVQAESEWSLAVSLGWSRYIAAGIPVALGAYAVRALHSGREIVLCVTAMIATVAASRLVHAGMLAVTPWLIIAVSAIPSLVMWRIRAIGIRAAAEQADATWRATTGPSAMPRVLAIPTADAIAPPRPEAAPPTPRPTPHMPVIGAPAPAPAALWDTPLPDGLDPAARVVAQLYRHLRRQPVTSEIEDALKAAGLKHGDGTCREARKRAKAGDETLAAYPLRPDLAAVAAS